MTRLSDRTCDDKAAWRRTVYRLLLAITLAIVCGRILSTRSRDGRTPFFSANDRSRWSTISALVDYGTHEIDEVRKRPGWQSIDMVRHANDDGQMRYYSSKPPLMAVMIAPQYALLRQITGAKFAERPFFVARAILLLTHIPLLLVYFWVMERMIERYGTTDFGRIFAFACAAFATFLTTFANTLNNHLPAAVCVLVTLECLDHLSRRSAENGRSARRWAFLAGLSAAFAVTCELPALSFFGLAALACLYLSPRQALLYFAPAALLVAVAFFATNLWAHGSLRPPYAHRETGNNWYVYPGSYWVENRQGVDLGEPDRGVYLFHCLVGHHGFFSLTPIWFLSVAGSYWAWRRGGVQWRALVVLGLGLFLLCVTFYVFFRPLIDRNYGGVTSGLRWLFWLIPLWTILLIPAADQMATRPRWQWLALSLLAISTLSASVPFANPWVHPWLYRLP